MIRIPVTIITGFIGSGKTTTLIGLMKQKPVEEKWLVMVNEFGTVSIDDVTIKSVSKGTKVIEISGGCTCCSSTYHFESTLNSAVTSDDWTQILIEANGLGGAQSVSELIRQMPRLVLNPIVCLVDIGSVAHAPLLNNLVYQRQIHTSDIIVFTKTNLLTDDSEVQEHISRFKIRFPNARIFPSFPQHLLYPTHSVCALSNPSIERNIGFEQMEYKT